MKKRDDEIVNGKWVRLFLDGEDVQFHTAYGGWSDLKDAKYPLIVLSSRHSGFRRKPIELPEIHLFLDKDGNYFSRVGKDLHFYKKEMEMLGYRHLHTFPKTQVEPK